MMTGSLRLPLGLTRMSWPRHTISLNCRKQRRQYSGFVQVLCEHPLIETHAAALGMYLLMQVAGLHNRELHRQVLNMQGRTSCGLKGLGWNRKAVPRMKIESEDVAKCAKAGAFIILGQIFPLRVHLVPRVSGRSSFNVRIFLFAHSHPEILFKP